MVLAVVIIGSLAIFSTVIAMLAFLPIIDELGYDEGGHWDNAQAIAKEQRDVAVRSIIALPAFLIGGIILWMFLAVSRRDVGDY